MSTVFFGKLQVLAPIVAQHPLCAHTRDSCAHTVVHCPGTLMACAVVSRAVRTDAVVGRGLHGVDVCRKEQKLPAVLFLLVAYHAAHLICGIMTACVFVSVCGDDEYRVLRHILGSCVFVDAFDMPN